MAQKPSISVWRSVSKPAYRVADTRLAAVQTETLRRDAVDTGSSRCIKACTHRCHIARFSAQHSFESRNATVSPVSCPPSPPSLFSYSPARPSFRLVTRRRKPPSPPFSRTRCLRECSTNRIRTSRRDEIRRIIEHVFELETMTATKLVPLPCKFVNSFFGLFFGFLLFDSIVTRKGFSPLTRLNYSSKFCRFFPNFNNREGRC